MRYAKFGKSGLEVSSIVLGAMSFGESSVGSHPWTLGRATSKELIVRALDHGVNAFDTANIYSGGTGEEILGTCLRELVPRDEAVIMTKVFNPLRPGPNAGGLSRLAILREIDASLRRLQTDYIDVYQIHRFDPTVPVEETMEALHDVVKAGKARYLGASSMFAWQFAKAQFAASANNWTRFSSMQVQYNLIAREEEREMLPFCIDQGVAVMAWSPLARGTLARDPSKTTERSQTDAFQEKNYRQFRDADARVGAAVRAVAEERGVSAAQVALAWAAQQPGITAPIVGATKSEHLDAAAAAIDIELTADECERLERDYVPHAPEGF